MTINRLEHIFNQEAEAEETVLSKLPLKYRQRILRILFELAVRLKEQPSKRKLWIRTANTVLDLVNEFSVYNRPITSLQFSTIKEIEEELFGEASAP